MLAPHPLVGKRGASPTTYNHIKALTQIGFEVDLITYHHGESVDLPGLRVFCTPRLPFMRQGKAGPSFAQLPLGFLAFFLAIGRLCCNRYDYLHTHEEAGLIGIILSAITGKRHLHYIHSHFSQHNKHSLFTPHASLTRQTRAMQAFRARHADSIIAIHPDIQKFAHDVSPYTPIYLIENHIPAESMSWLVFLQKCMQVQKDFTGEEITIEQTHMLPEVTTVLPKVTKVTIVQVEKMEERTCAV
jgi:hypothetical protein